jgi:hypothetical protein
MNVRWGLVVSLVLACGLMAALGSGVGCGDDAEAPARFECGADQPVAAAGVADTGYAKCENGVVHRAAARTCGSLLPRTDTCSLTPQVDACHSDADCTDTPHDYCGWSIGGTGTAVCACHHGCMQDSDCASGFVCLCGEPIGTCISAACSTDADCGDALCRVYATADCGLDRRLACESSADECVTDADCGSPNICVHDGSHATCGGQCTF